jgi:hypothetical protein
MRYYVTGEDGRRYGPADEALLRDWATQGRLTPNSLLEPESGGAGIYASALPGLQFPPIVPNATSAAPYGAPYNVPYAPNPYGQPVGGYANRGWGNWEIQLCWGIAIVSAFALLCGMGAGFAALGIIVCVVLMFRGVRAFGPLILCIAVIVMNVLLFRQLG